jgi:hypothetical protein
MHFPESTTSVPECHVNGLNGHCESAWGGFRDGKRRILIVQSVPPRFELAFEHPKLWALECQAPADLDESKAQEGAAILPSFLC